jgi:PAS domain S-box-containing protein
MKMLSMNESHAYATATSEPLPFDQAIITTDRVGVVRSCCPQCEKIVGHKATELVGRHISILIPKLGDLELMLGDEINPRLRYQSRCAIPFQARQRDGASFAIELIFRRLHDAAGIQLMIRNLGRRAEA